MDPPRVTCPQCGKDGPFRPEMIGRRVRCPGCDTWFPGPFAFPAVRERLFPLWEKMNDPVLAKLLRGLVPLAARATLMGGVLSLGSLVGSQSPYLLGGVAAAWAYRQRNRLNFGTIFGSARFESLSALESARMVGRGGLLLGRYRESDFRRSRALLRLFTRPWSESDAVCRHFLTSLTNRRLDFTGGEAGPLLCAPRGSYNHLVTVAPTGAGKGVGSVIPNLLNYPGSAFVVDIKGENYKATAAYRKSLGQTIVVIDPCGITGATSATLNPLSMLDVRSPTIVEDARTVAEALVVKTAQDHDPHWNEHAVTVLTATILLVVCLGTKEERTLNHVRAIVSSREELETALGVMRDSEALGGMLARYGAQIAAIPENERGSVVSTLNRHTNFADSPLVAASLASTSFDLRSVARRATTVYLALPVQYLAALSRLMRIWISTLLLVIKQGGASEEHEVLFLLDEVAQLGELKSVEEAVTLLRGFGLKCWLILQSVAQLESCYGKARARTILGNCQTQQFLGVADYESAEYLSKCMGDMTIVSPNEQEGDTHSSGPSPGSSSSGRNRGRSFSAAGRKLLQPDEILRQPDAVFILHRGMYPIVADRIKYYSDEAFAGEVDSDEGSPARPVSRVSVALSVLGLLLALYWAKEGIEWPTGPQRVSGSFLAEAPASGLQTLLADPGSPRDKTALRQPPRPRGPVVTDCPHCGKRGPIPADYAGEELTCPRCGHSFLVTLP